jgi:hypothetical protein
MRQDGRRMLEGLFRDEQRPTAKHGAASGGKARGWRAPAQQATRNEAMLLMASRPSEHSMSRQPSAPAAGGYRRQPVGLA